MIYTTMVHQVRYPIYSVQSPTANGNLKVQKVFNDDQKDKKDKFLILVHPCPSLKQISLDKTLASTYHSCFN